MINLSPQEVDRFGGLLQTLLTPEGVCQAFGVSPYAKYADDPVRFCEEVLGDTLTDDIKKVMRSVWDNPITIAKSCNGPGKSHGAGRIAVAWYKCHEHAQVYTAAAPPERNLKKILWGEIGSIVEDHPGLFTEDEVTSLNIQRKKKQFLCGVTIPTSGTEQERISKFSGKHAPYLLFILDEGDGIMDEIYTAIETCRSGGIKAHLLIMFNPKSQIGEVYRMERDKRANVIQLSAFSHPNVITGEQKIPGAVTRDATVRRINEWCRHLHEDEEHGENCFELPDFLEGTTTETAVKGTFYPALRPGWYKIMEPAFSYMVLGEYPAEGSRQLISRDSAIMARQRWDA